MAVVVVAPSHYRPVLAKRQIVKVAGGNRHEVVSLRNKVRPILAIEAPGSQRAVGLKPQSVEGLGGNGREVTFLGRIAIGGAPEDQRPILPQRDAVIPPAGDRHEVASARYI